MCKTCYGYNYLRTGTICTKDKRMCEMYKTEIYHIANSQKKLIEKTIDKQKPSTIEIKRLNRANIIINELKKIND